MAKKIQYATIKHAFKKLTKEELTFVQEVIGAFLYYARGIDTTMLPAVGTIATHTITAPFTTLKKKIDRLLDYAHTHPNAAIKYSASKMRL